MHEKLSKPGSCEIAMWKVTVSSICYTVLGVYRPPDTSETEFGNDLIDVLSNIIPNNNNVIVMGDLNMHWNKYDNPNVCILDDSLNALGLDRITTQPTHKSGNILDIICLDLDLAGELYEHSYGDFLTDHRFIMTTLK